MTQCIQKRAREQGFTLVELAIVMIIIGLLIGGVLKGQELINNAQVSASVAELKSVDAAISGFRDAYNALPGDIQNAASRISGCTNACALAASDGNGQIGGIPSAAYGAMDNENNVAWTHLSAAEFLGGVDPTPNAAAAPVAGDTVPDLDIGNGTALKIGFSLDGDLDQRTATAAARRGHYVLIGASPEAAADTANTPSLLPNQAQRVDTKIDDGRPNTGSVLGLGAVNDCSAANPAGGAGGDPDAIYNEANTAVQCGLYMRVQS